MPATGTGLVIDHRCRTSSRAAPAATELSRAPAPHRDATRHRGQERRLPTRRTDTAAPTLRDRSSGRRSTPRTDASAATHPPETAAPSTPNPRHRPPPHEPTIGRPTTARSGPASVSPQPTPVQRAAARDQRRTGRGSQRREKRSGRRLTLDAHANRDTRFVRHVESSRICRPGIVKSHVANTPDQRARDARCR